MHPTTGPGEPASHEPERDHGRGPSAADTLADAAEPVKKKAETFAEHEKAEGAERMDDVARAVHNAAGTLEERLPRVAGYAHDAATRLEGAASSLRERDIGELVTAFTDFARRQPAAVFGGAVLAGLAFSRFLKSSGPGGHEPHQP